LRRTQRAFTRLSNLATLGSYIGLYTGEAFLGKAIVKDANDRLSFYGRNVGKWSKKALDRMNFEINVIGRDEKLMRERNFLVVSNHMSYLDILVMSTIQPFVFVTSVDMGEVFFLGTMAELGGSIFIERRNRSKIDRDLGVMSQTLRAGHNVMLYPEGTSLNGECVGPFKKSLLMAAVEAGVDVLPICLKYTEIDGEPFGPANADKVCWYGNMDFAPHFLSLTDLNRVKVEVHFLDPIKVTPEVSRHELTEKAHAAISSCYGRYAVAGPDSNHLFKNARA
jgi:1-acyl-sn-glycerol-3-phosphate acyltransferase